MANFYLAHDINGSICTHHDERNEQLNHIGLTKNWKEKFKGVKLSLGTANLSENVGSS